MFGTGGLNHLAKRLEGSLLRPDEPGFDDARTIWNAMIDRRPAAIARCHSADDAAAAVTFARRNGLPIAVRGGGHNVSGSSVCDGGLMIDLSPMRGVEVDPGTRTARVQGGATLGDLDRATQKFGLAAPGGVVSTTGVGGLTLGGGFGWLSRKYGLAADNLLAATIVTAAGRPLVASETENPDLFWALRGGGGNFGVVTEFTFRLHEVGPEILFGPTVYALEDAPSVLRNYRDFARTAPRECCVWVDLLTTPPLPFLAEQHRGIKGVSVMQCYLGDPEQGEPVLAPLREFGTPLGDGVMVRPFTAAQSILDDAYSFGARNYWKAHNFTELTDEALDTVVASAQVLPTPQSDILICQLGGAIADVPADATAYPHRSAAFAVTPGARWQDPAQDSEMIAWARACHGALTPHAAGGAYSNFIAETHGAERDAYGANYDRLRAVKEKYDPGNLFRFNQNVTPAG